jgi:hypothetical protein
VKRKKTAIAEIEPLEGDDTDMLICTCGPMSSAPAHRFSTHEGVNTINLIVVTLNHNHITSNGDRHNLSRFHLLDFGGPTGCDKGAFSGLFAASSYQVLL